MSAGYSVVTALADKFRIGAAQRDKQRQLPFAEIDELSQAGIYALTVPHEFGGPGAPPSEVAQTLRILATADPNIAQIPQSHFVYVRLLQLAGTPAQQRFYFERILRGDRLANAQSERNTRTITDLQTELVDGRLHGTKYYCTGTLFAQWIPVLTRADEVVYLPADAPGVDIVDDWDALGQRLTGSGTVKLDGVAVDPAWVVPRGPAFDGPTGYGAFAQLLHAAIDVGIARAALDDAAEFVRTRSRPWFEADVERAQDDPLLVQRFGELAVAVHAAEAALESAGRAVDLVFAEPTDAHAGQASIAVATAKVLGERAAVDVSAAAYEVSGTRSAVSDLDRHWRNARTHTLHDPVRWKYQHIGRYVLDGTPPPRHGLI